MAMTTSSPTCPVCEGTCAPFASIDFNQSCHVPGSAPFAPAGWTVAYVLCAQCGFCYAPELWAWSPAQFREHIYNDGYIQVDPDYAGVRPKANAANLTRLFGDHANAIRHLDFGGGDGLLAAQLRQAGWDSSSYDPFVDLEVAPGELGKFDLITAFEVFEHVPDVDALMTAMLALLAPGGVILFSTMVSDGQIGQGQPLDWWYAAPRNGHISLFSRRSLGVLGARYGLHMMSFSPGFHLYTTGLPQWASHLAPGSRPRLPPEPVAPKPGLLKRWLIRLVNRLLSVRG